MLLACCLQSRLVYRVWVAAVGCWLRFVFLWILIHSNPREPISAAVEQKCLIRTAASAFMVAVRLWTLKLVFTGTSDVCCGRLCQSKNHVCADCAVIGLKHPSHSGSSQTPLLVTMVTGWSRHSTERHRCLTAHPQQDRCQIIYWFHRLLQLLKTLLALKKEESRFPPWINAV